MFWLTNAKILDVQRSRYRSGALVVDGERIIEITRKSVAPKGAEVIDLAGRYLLPGLMDCHVHLTLPTDTADPYAPPRRSDALTALNCAEAARRLVTSTRGSPTV